MKFIVLLIYNSLVIRKNNKRRRVMNCLYQSKRISDLKEKMLSSKRYASIEQARIITRVYQENEKLSLPKKRALSLKAALEELEISVEDEELIVGNRTKGIRYGVVFPESGCSWINQEFETLPTRPQDQFLVKEEDIKEFREKINLNSNEKKKEYAFNGNKEKEINEIIKPENLVYGKPRLMNENPMHYCPGCSHGVIHKLIAEVIAEMGMEDKTIGISPVGCAVFAYNYLDIDWIEAAHGRAPAIATAVKRLNPGKMVFTYQGDGDLAAIGTAETIHAANRGENIVIVFVNNAIYGMTGGQMAPTTLEGMPTATCPYGRNIALNGYPLKIGDLLAQLEGTCLVTRQSVQTAAAVRKAKKMLRKAFENSMAGKGTSIVEFVSTCSSGWKMTPEKANKWMEENMFPFYPLGDLKNKE